MMIGIVSSKGFFYPFVHKKYRAGVRLGSHYAELC
jgi:hypothetical protein